MSEKLWVEGGPGPRLADGRKPTLGELIRHDDHLRMQQMIDAAVAAENEACAKILDPPTSAAITSEANLARHVRTMFAAAIRARRRYDKQECGE